MGAHIGGIYLEGPFFTMKHVGAQNPVYLIDPSVETFDMWQEKAGGRIVKSALAAEKDGACEYCAALDERDVVTSIGHSDATYDEALAAVNAGASCFVHTYNDQRGLHHRDPGVVGAAMTTNGTYAEIICDGRHVVPGAVKALVDVDRDWVPHADGASLYIRPFCIATDVGLGVHAAKHYRFAIICSPSGAYYAEGLDPVRIYVEDEYIRAAPGLTGFTKCGGNYAASIKAGELAEERGFSQVLWLDGVEKKYVEEVGSMNILFKIDGKIYTAACTGTVLPGVTRRSIIELLRDWGYEVIEGKLAIADVMKAADEGKLEEVFGTGTAAVVSPVKELDWEGKVAHISGGKIGELTQKLYDTLTGIQWGKLPDTKGWTVPVDPQ